MWLESLRKQKSRIALGAARDCEPVGGITPLPSAFGPVVVKRGAFCSYVLPFLLHFRRQPGRPEPNPPITSPTPVGRRLTAVSESPCPKAAGRDGLQGVNTGLTRP